MTHAHAILVVEDTPECLAAFFTMLTDADIGYDLVKDRVSAERELSNRKYDLLLLDIRLETELDQNVDPQTSGVTLLEDLRNGKCGNLNQQIRVLVLTAHPELAIEDKLLGELGAKVFMAKPKVDRKLFTTVISLLPPSKGLDPRISTVLQGFAAEHGVENAVVVEVGPTGVIPIDDQLWQAFVREYGPTDKWGRLLGEANEGHSRQVVLDNKIVVAAQLVIGVEGYVIILGDTYVKGKNYVEIANKLCEAFARWEKTPQQ